MRPLEVVLLGGLLLVGLGRLGARRWPWTMGRLAAVLFAVVVVVHLVIEGGRRPMAFAYLLTGLALVAALWARPTRPTRSSALAAVGRWGGGLLLLGLTVIPPWLLPVFTLPAPGGDYAIGTTSFSLADRARREQFGPAPGGPREIDVRVWYPAPPGVEGTLATYASPHELNGGILGMLGIGVLVGNQFDYVRTHSVLEAPIAEAATGFPVLIFSHGYSGFSGQNTPQMEDLASRGYVVFSISHTHDAGATVFDDGRVVMLDPAIGQMFTDLSGRLDSVNAAIEGLRKATTPVARQAAFRVFASLNHPRIEASAPVWAADTRFVLDYLEGASRDDPGGALVGRLDLGRIGIFGMSFGGSNAGEVCRVDHRCKAGINMDGQQLGPLVFEDSLTVPFMIMSSSTALPVHRPAFDRLRGPAFLVELRGTEHLALSDTPLVAPHLLRWLGVTGSMKPARSESLMTAYVGAFFDRYLRGLPAPLLSQAAPDPDVAFEYKNLGSGAP